MSQGYLHGGFLRGWNLNLSSTGEPPRPRDSDQDDDGKKDSDGGPSSHRSLESVAFVTPEFVLWASCNPAARADHSIVGLLRPIENADRFRLRNWLGNTHTHTHAVSALPPEHDRSAA